MARQIKKIKKYALEYALNTLERELEGIHLYTITGDTYDDRKAGQPLQWGVNWSAMGTKSVEETKKFAQSLMEATEICELVNSLEILDKAIEDDKEYTHDQFIRECEIIQKLLLVGVADYINMWFDKEVE